MKLATQVAWNTIVQIISKILATVLGLVSIAIITRHLGQIGFGQYTTIITFLSFFAIFADLGLTLVTVQMISVPGADQKKILGNLFTLRLITAFLIIGLAPLAVLLFPYGGDIKQGVLIASLAFIFIALNQVLVGIFQKQLRMDKVSIAEVVSRIILIAGILIANTYQLGLNGILYATIGANFISFIMHLWFSRKYCHFEIRYDIEVWRQIFTKSWPLALTIALNLLYLKTDTLLLSLIKRPTDIGIMAEVGLYGAAYKVIDVLVAFPFMFAGIILPILTIRWAEKNKLSFNNILQRSFNVMAIIAMPLMIGTTLVSSDLMSLIAGTDFTPAGPILNLLIIACGAIFLGCIFAHAIIALDKQKKIIGAYIFVAITSVIGYILIIPYYSYIGAAWITIYSEITIALASAYLVFKYSGFIPKWNIFLKTLIASIIMYLATKTLIHYIQPGIIITLVSAISVYFLSLYLIKGITKQEIREIMNK